ncbi:MAG: hypothetical protein V1746_01060 [bacterium]
MNQDDKSVYQVDLAANPEKSAKGFAFLWRAFHGNRVVPKGINPELLKEVLSQYKHDGEILEASDEAFAKLIEEAKQKGAIVVVGGATSPSDKKEGEKKGVIVDIAEFFKRQREGLAFIGALGLFGGEIAETRAADFSQPTAGISAGQAGKKPVLLARDRHRHHHHRPPPRVIDRSTHIDRSGNTIIVGPAERLYPVQDQSYYTVPQQPSYYYNYWWYREQPAQPSYNPQQQEEQYRQQYRQWLEEENRRLEELRRQQEEVRIHNEGVLKRNAESGFFREPGESVKAHNERALRHNAELGIHLLPGETIDQFNEKVRAFRERMEREKGEAEERHRKALEEFKQQERNKGQEDHSEPDGSVIFVPKKLPPDAKKMLLEELRREKEKTKEQLRDENYRKQLLEEYYRGKKGGGLLPQDDNPIQLSQGGFAIVSCDGNIICVPTKEEAKEPCALLKGISGMENKVAQGGKNGPQAHRSKENSKLPPDTSVNLTQRKYLNPKSKRIC